MSVGWYHVLVYFAIRWGSWGLLGDNAYFVLVFKGQVVNLVVHELLVQLAMGRLCVAHVLIFLCRFHVFLLLFLFFVLLSSEELVFVVKWSSFEVVGGVYQTLVGAKVVDFRIGYLQIDQTTTSWALDLFNLLLGLLMEDLPKVIKVRKLKSPSKIVNFD